MDLYVRFAHIPISVVLPLPGINDLLSAAVVHLIDAHCFPSVCSLDYVRD